MNKRPAVFLISGLLFGMAALILAACGAAGTPIPATVTPTLAPPPEATATSAGSEVNLGELGAAAKAVDLLAAWVEAGSPEKDGFDYQGVDGNTYPATFEVDILPLFTQNSLWFEGAQACSGCHFGNMEASYHEMDLTSYTGIMSGGDVLSDPPGVPILGQSAVGEGDFDWSHAKLRERLRNNRMPPGWPFDITEANRDGPCIEIDDGTVMVQKDSNGELEYGCEFNAVSIIGAWVEAGAPESDSFEYGGEQVTFAETVQPFFTQPDMWFKGSQACSGCHFGNSEVSYHEMDLSTYAGIMSGGDVLSDPPGVPILGQSAAGETDYDWEHSKLRERLRNNRMPPGVPFDITEENRDGPLVLHGKRVEVEEEKPGGTLFGSGECEVKAVDLIAAWVEGGSPDEAAFTFQGLHGELCEGTYEADIQPLFTENNVWYQGAQACSGCHFGNIEASYHEMDLTSYTGIMSGGDVLSDPPGVPILGQSAAGETDFDWSHAKLRERLRNNRMPPGWPFDITETNRDGACIEIEDGKATVEKDNNGELEYGCELNAVGLIGAWVEAGAPESDPFEYGGEQVTFADAVQPFFTQPDMWFKGSQACASCHFGNSEASYHEMDLGTYAGILSGGDVLSDPPGVPILGQSAIGETDYDWEHSKLRERLRNNRMPPGVPFDITEENRDGPVVLAGKKK